MSGGGTKEEGVVMRNVDALFGIDVVNGAAAATSSAQGGMRVVPVYSANDGVYKSNITPPPPGSSPPPSHHNHHVNGGAAQPNEYQQQQPMMMMMMMKKKRGRPRKYSGGGVEGTDVNMSLALMPPPTHHTAPPPLVTQPVAIPASSSAAAPPTQTATGGGGGEFSPASGGGGEGQQPMFKKARGRPPGSTNKITKKNRQHPQLHYQIQQPLPLHGSSGVGFTPHIISVKAGEDVSSKIMSFSQNGPRAVCILSANGSISNVTLRQAATSGGTATYEGRFEILSLCGSFLLTEVAGQRSRTGGLSVSLAGPDGRVLGGCVAGLLTAASPIQVIVGSFIPDGKKELMKTVNHTVESTPSLSSLPMPMPMSMSMSMPPMLFSGGGGAYAAAPPTAGVNSGSPPSQGGGGGSFDDESSGQEEEEEEEGGSPPDHGTGGSAAINNHHHINNGNPHAMLGMPWR